MAIQYNIEELLIAFDKVNVDIDGKNIIRNIGNEQIPFNIHNITRENIHQGQITAVLGRSGRGKSTLFKALSGILPPSQGKIIVPDEKNKGSYRKVKEGDLGYVQQIYPLSRNQSVYQMLMDACKQGNIKANDAKNIIDKYLEDWELIDQKKSPSNQLSGGQRQRVAIIEQLLCNHHFIIFDEPFSGLDIININEVKDSFHLINTSNEINTILFSTHDIEIAVELADQIYIIGYERNEKNEYLPGGTIVGSYDLKKMGIAWQAYSQNHSDLVTQIKKQMELS